MRTSDIEKESARCKESKFNTQASCTNVDCHVFTNRIGRQAGSKSEGNMGYQKKKKKKKKKTNSLFPRMSTPQAANSMLNPILSAGLIG